MKYDRLTVIEKINSLKGEKRTDNYKSNPRIAEYLGVDEKTVKNWLNKKPGHPDIPFKHIPKLCEYLGCDIEYLLDGDMHYKTKETKDICEITGLTEEAVEILRDKNKGKIRAEITNFLIKDFGNYESLMSNILRCLEDKKQMEEYKKNKWFSEISTLIDGYTKRNAETDNILNYPFTIEDAYNDINGYIEAALLKKGYTEEEVEAIQYETDGFFCDYRAKALTDEMTKAILHNMVTRYIDNHLF